jgi:hypothetical protein
MYQQFIKETLITLTFGDRYSLGLNAIVSHTTNNYVYQETNLVPEPFF